MVHKAQQERKEHMAHRVLLALKVQPVLRDQRERQERNLVIKVYLLRSKDLQEHRALQVLRVDRPDTKAFRHRYKGLPGHRALRALRAGRPDTKARRPLYKDLREHRVLRALHA